MDLIKKLHLHLVIAILSEDNLIIDLYLSRTSIST